MLQGNRLQLLVRNQSGHFTCAVYYQGVYVYIDDFSCRSLRPVGSSFWESVFWVIRFLYKYYDEARFSLEYFLSFFPFGRYDNDSYWLVIVMIAANRCVDCWFTRTYEIFCRCDRALKWRPGFIWLIIKWIVINFLFSQLSPCHDSSILKAMQEVKNPHDSCKKLYDLIRALVVQINEKCDDPCNNPNKNDLYHDESLNLMKHRWEKIEKDFYSNEGFDISLIPDIYDCVKYDYLHNT